jgi:tetratricopeptide (TPR) repeat protein
MSDEPMIRQCEREDASVAFASGDRSVADAEDAERHLSGCEICQEAVSAWVLAMGDGDDDEATAVDEVVRSVRPRASRLGGDRPASGDVVPIERARPTRRWPSGRLAAALAAAACLVIAVAVALVAFRPKAETDLADGFTALQASAAKTRPTALRASWQTDYAPYERVRSRNTAPSNEQLHIARLSFESEASARDSADAHRGLAGVALVSQDYDRAIAELTAARGLAPRDPAVVTDLAVAYAAKGDLRAASAALEEAAALAPDRLDVLYDRALVSELLGDADRARREWAAYLERDGTSNWAAEARDHLGRFGATAPTSDH